MNPTASDGVGAGGGCAIIMAEEEEEEEEEVAIDDSRGSNNGRLISPLTTHYAPSLPSSLPLPPRSTFISPSLPHFAQHPRLTATWRVRCQLISAAPSPCSYIVMY